MILLRHQSSFFALPNPSRLFIELAAEAPLHVLITCSRILCPRCLFYDLFCWFVFFCLVLLSLHPPDSLEWRGVSPCDGYLLLFPANGSCVWSVYREGSFFFEQFHLACTRCDTFLILRCCVLLCFVAVVVIESERVVVCSVALFYFGLASVNWACLWNGDASHTFCFPLFTSNGVLRREMLFFLIVQIAVLNAQSCCVGCSATSAGACTGFCPASSPCFCTISGTNPPRCNCGSSTGPSCFTSMSSCLSGSQCVKVQTVFSGTSCTGQVMSETSFPPGLFCTPSCSATSFVGQSGSTTCEATFPPIPSNLQSQFVWTDYVSTTSCSGPFNSRKATQTGVCLGVSPPSTGSQRIICNADGSTNQTTFSSNDCSGAPFISGGLNVGVCNTAGGSANIISSCPVPTTTTKTTTKTATTSSSSTTTPAGSGTGNSCFHETTRISYNGEKAVHIALFDMHRECAIPHKVVGNGVKIETAIGATLRVTPDHLVFTPTGPVAAGTLRIGSVVETADSTTRVTKIVQEHNQVYYGLNCLHSVVIAEGIKASTFGNYHAVPAWWMKVTGRVLGIQTASNVGDVIASTLAKIGML